MLTKQHRGLNEKQVEQSAGKLGTNRLSPPQQTTFMRELWKTFKNDSLIKILAAALVVTVIIAIIGYGEWLEAVGIAIAVILATTVSTYSEYSNNKLFQKLQDEYSKILCKVYRVKNGENHVTDIKIDDIVTGDLILLQAGDKIPADGIIVDGDLKVNQASLNGESDECKKIAAEDESVFDAENIDFLHKNCVFRGSVVNSGEAVMKVMAVGDRSQFGKLANELNENVETISPLKSKLSRLAGIISKIAYIGAILIALSTFLMQIFGGGGFVGYFQSTPVKDIIAHIADSVILSIVIIVVAVPEGLPMMIALVSGLNMKKLLKDNILIRTIDGAETAGSLNILFSDKTGTITKGRLQVVNFYDAEINASADFSEINKPLKLLMQTAINENSSAVVNINGGNVEIVGGNMTERALHEFVGNKAEQTGIKYNKLNSTPFNSKNKFSIVTLESDGEITSFIKGAPERIFDFCSKYYDKNGSVCDFTAEMKEKMQKHMDSLASKAMRVLAFAAAEGNIDDNAGFDNLAFIGIVGIRDELRPEAVSAIKTAHRAGIQVVMVTGDKKETAYAISSDAGLVKDSSDIVITSTDMAAMSDDELKKIIPNLRVVARALPTDKSRLVRVCQELNLVVGMTGDGVNDAPALKKADVGFAMGSGTEVAKEAADITILDNNFNSVVKTVLYGRTIYNNIRKFIIFQLTINFAAVMISFIGPFIGLKHPLSVVQMLWVNIVMDTLAALAFGTEPALDRYMDEKPKIRTESIISPFMWARIIGVGAYLTAASLLFFNLPFVASMFRGTPDNLIYLQTGFFAFFVLSAMLNGFNARTDKLNIFDNIHRNPNFFIVLGFIVIIQVIMTYIGGTILRTAGLVFGEWIFVAAAALLIIPVGILIKAVFIPVFNKKS